MSCGGNGGGGILAAASAAGAPLSPVALLVARARFREDERGGARIAVGILLRCWTLREIVLFRDCFRWEGNYVKCQYSGLEGIWRRIGSSPMTHGYPYPILDGGQLSRSCGCESYVTHATAFLGEKFRMG